MNKINEQYYSYGRYDGCVDYGGSIVGGPINTGGQTGITSIGGLMYDEESGKLMFQYVKDEKIQTSEVTIPSGKKSVTDIKDMKLIANDENGTATLTLKFIKNGEEKSISVNLDDLQDDIIWSEE